MKMTKASQGQKPVMVSISGGKDSTATLLLALETVKKDHIWPVFADTGNEHPETYKYLGYLERELSITIKWVKKDFTDLIHRRRSYIENNWPGKGVSEAVCKRAMNAMVPTGNPFLDLCLWKGRFPSTMVRFCTEHLKTEPLTIYSLSLTERYGQIESWQGIRADESRRRSTYPEREMLSDDVEVYRPILRWSTADVFAHIKKAGIEPNPLYTQGMNRVGCMPCINSRKSEISEISKRFPEVIERISEWEKNVGMGSKRQSSTFFPSPGENETAYERGNVWEKVKWSNDYNVGQGLFKETEDEVGCSSSYGLCE